MLRSRIQVHLRLFKRHKTSSAPEYSTDVIESILRSEMDKLSQETITKLVTKNKFLLQIKPDEMKKSLQQVKKLNFQSSDVKTHPDMLLQSEYQLANNFQRLHEVGFTDVTAYRLANFRKILSKSVYFNQNFNFLPKSVNVIENTFKIAKIPLTSDDHTTYDVEMPLEAVHRLAIRNYMINRTKFTNQELDEISYHYPAFKTRSLQSIDTSVRLLENLYNIPVRQLPKFILNFQPDEIEQLVASETVSGIDVRSLMTMGPTCNLARINEIQAICQSYKLPEYAIAYSPLLFTMSPDTLKERLDTLGKLSRAKEFVQHVAIGRVILAMRRLNSHLLSQKMAFDSVFNDNFVDFWLNGFIFRNPPIFYLGKTLQKSADEIKNALQTHPHSKSLTFPVIHENIKYLSKKGFTNEDIFNDLHIILYSLDEIKDFFIWLKNPTELHELSVDPTKLSKSQILRLCMYRIEKKSGFNGEGIFLRSRAVEFNDDESWRMEEIIKKTCKLF